MWFFKEKKISLTDIDFFKDFEDCHNHILPAVDDGVQTIKEATESLDFFESIGVKKISLTPHVMKGMGTLGDMPRRFQELQEVWKGQIELNLAGEYMLDSGFSDQLDKGLRSIHDKVVLVETSYYNPPNDLSEMLYNTVISGYTPLIAHPERYVYMNDSSYERLKEKEYPFQLNVLSLVGFYGKPTKEKAEKLLKKGMYNKVGTDIHSLERFKKWITLPHLSSKLVDKLLELKAS